MTNKKVTCAIMAGGKNRRYNGQDKSFVEISGKPIIEIILDEIEDIFEEIIIVTNSPNSYKKYMKRCKIVTDEIKNIGPLGGFYTAMVNKDSIFYLACDMPFIKKVIIKKQIDFFYKNNCQVLQPLIGNLLEPMHSIYKRNLSEKLLKFLEKAETYSILTFLRKLNVSSFELEDIKENIIPFMNINSKKDLENILSLHNNIDNQDFLKKLNEKRTKKGKVQDYISKNITN